MASNLPPAVTAKPTGKIPFRPRKTRRISDDPKAQKEPADKAVAAPIPRPLTATGELAAAVLHLRAADPLLARVIDAHGPPSFPTTRGPPFFPSLARSILNQQLAVKAAATIHARFVALCGGAVSPDAVLALTQNDLRGAGVSARKASYIHDLASKYRSGFLSDAAVADMDDAALSERLVAVKGIGPWSVHMFMMFSLRRPDVLPVGDLGVRKGVQALYGLKEVPGPAKMEQFCEAWRPYRSVGAWYMWRLVEAKGAPTIAAAAAAAP